MDAITQVLNAIEQGDPHAAEQLLPLVYDELRELAAQKLAQEKPGQTLQATALVHEAYLRLVGGGAGPALERPRPFLRRRRRGHAPHPGRPCPPEAQPEARRRLAAASTGRRGRGGAGASEDVVALDEALDLLAQHDPVKAELVKLRYFAGLTVEEAAELLGVSRATADRHWRFAKTWLYCELTREGGPLAE